VISSRDLIDKVGFSGSTLYLWRQNGKLAPVSDGPIQKLNGAYLYYKTDVKRAVKTQKFHGGIISGM